MSRKDRRDRHQTRTERGSKQIADETAYMQQKRNFVVVPKTENQKKYMDALKSCNLVIAKGSAGTGKTFLAAYHAAKEYLKGNVTKIYITRPNITMGRDGGSIPGSDYEKLEAFVMPMLEVLKKVLGNGKFEYMINKKIIEVAPIEKIRGRSFEDCCIIADEFQNVRPPHAESVVTRLGENAQMIICGDSHQHDLNGLTGIEYLVNVINKYCIDDTAVIEFYPSDCVRSGITRAFLMAFEEEWKTNKGGQYK